MNTSSNKVINPNRTYKDQTNGEYFNSRQYMTVAVSLGCTHFFLEFLYIYLGCTPMIYINILGFLCYVVSGILIQKGHHLHTVWIMENEVFFHVIFACIFMGYNCGYQLWLYGTFSSLFLPFFIPNLSKRPKMQIGIAVFLIVIVFEVLTYLNNHGLLPQQYRVSDNVARILYYINALLGFGAIMVYTSIYNIGLQRILSRYSFIFPPAEKCELCYTILHGNALL